MTGRLDAQRALFCGPPVTREGIVERAKQWLHPPVHYDPAGFHTTQDGTYRTDAAGFVSMAWALPADVPGYVGGLDVLALSTVGFDITKAELAAGDLLLRTDGSAAPRHVVLFEQWADLNRRKYWGLEMTAALGATHHVVRYPYDDAASKYRPYRYFRTVTDADPVR